MDCFSANDQLVAQQVTICNNWQITDCQLSDCMWIGPTLLSSKALTSDVHCGLDGLRAHPLKNNRLGMDRNRAAVPAMM